MVRTLPFCLIDMSQPSITMPKTEDSRTLWVYNMNLANAHVYPTPLYDQKEIVLWRFCQYCSKSFPQIPTLLHFLGVR